MTKIRLDYSGRSERVRSPAPGLNPHVSIPIVLLTKFRSGIGYMYVTVYRHVHKSTRDASAVHACVEEHFQNERLLCVTSKPGRGWLYYNPDSDVIASKCHFIEGGWVNILAGHISANENAGGTKIVYRVKMRISVLLGSLMAVFIYLGINGMAIRGWLQAMSARSLLEVIFAASATNAAACFIIFCMEGKVRNELALLRYPYDAVINKLKAPRSKTKTRKRAKRL